MSYEESLCDCRPLWSRRLQTAMEGGLTSSSHAGRAMRPTFTLLGLSLVYSERQTPERSLWAATVLVVCLLDCSLSVPKEDGFGCRCRTRSQSSAGLQVNHDRWCVPNRTPLHWNTSYFECAVHTMQNILLLTPINVMFPVRQRKWDIPDSSSSRKEEHRQQVCRYLQRQVETLASTLTLGKEILNSSGTT